MKNQCTYLFQSFKNEEDAFELTSALKANEIDYSIEVGKKGFDPAFVFETEIRVYIHENDEERALNLFTETIPADYYLYQFSDNELMEIVTKRDEWNDLDFKLALNLLRKRGKEIQPEVIQLLVDQRLQSLKQPEKSQKTWIYAGYILAFVSGFLGLFIGLSLRSSKKTLPNGEKMYTYIESDRKHGLYIALISIVILSITFLTSIVSLIGMHSQIL